MGNIIKSLSPQSLNEEKRPLHVSELAKEFEISTRTIRYYEEIGLLNPERTKGNQRIFSRKDRAKLKLILRGKRLGFSLEEIREMIEMYDVAGEPEQIRLTLKYGERKLKEIEEKIRELELLREDILNLREMLIKRLEELEKGS